MMDNVDTMSEVTQAISKLESFDADLRYMGLSDLKSIFEGPQRLTLVSEHYRVLQQVKSEVLKHLADPITEVQTQAVKTLGPLIKLLPEHEIVSVISSIATQKSSTVLTLALRTVIQSSLISASIGDVIVQLVLQRSNETEYKPSIEDCDVVNDLIRRFGPYLGQPNINPLLELIMTRVEKKQGTTGNIVRRRSFEALGLLAPFESDEQWEAQRHFIASTLVPPAAASINGVKLVMNLCTTAPNRVSTIPNVVKSILDIAQTVEIDETNVELIERSLAATETLYLSGHISAAQVVELVKKYTQYNPNYVGGDDTAEDEDMGSEFELSDDEDFGYDDDLSWKLRRYAVRLAIDVAENDQVQAVQLVHPLIELLRIESEQAVQEQAVTALVNFTTTSELLDEIRPHIGLFIDLASKEQSTGVYLPLLSALADIDALGQAQIQSIVSIAASRSKRAVLPATLSLVQSLASEIGPEPKLLPLVAQGLADVEYQTVTLALDAALALGSPELVETVYNVLRKTQNLSIQGQALKVTAAITDEAHSEQVLLYELNALDKPDLQVPALAAIQELVERFHLRDAAITQAAIRVLELLKSSKLRAVAYAAFRILRRLANRNRMLSSDIFEAAQSHDTWDPTTTVYKCELLSEISSTAGVADFALAAGRRFCDIPGADDTQLAIIKLWGAIASTSFAPELLAKAQETASLGKGAQFWAQVVAEVAVIADVPVDVSFDEFGVYLITALAERNRSATSLSDLAQAIKSNEVSPLVLGPAMAELALSSGKKTELYQAASAASDVASAEMYLSALEVLLQREPDAEISLVARKLVDVPPGPDLQLVGKLLGQAVSSLPEGFDVLNGWPVLYQLVGAKHAFKTVPASSQIELENIFVGHLTDTDIHVRETALEALSWALQQAKGASSPLSKLIPGIIQSTYVDKSLLEVIQMGPFKHTVDHGLAARKAAYEALYALASTRGNEIARASGAQLVDALVRGLRDEHDVRMLALYILEALASSGPSSSRLLAEAKPLLSEAFTEIEAIKVRETSVKQEHDRQAEALQALNVTKRAIGMI